MLQFPWKRLEQLQTATEEKSFNVLTLASSTTPISLTAPTNGESTLLERDLDVSQLKDGDILEFEMLWSVALKEDDAPNDYVRVYIGDVLLSAAKIEKWGSLNCSTRLYYRGENSLALAYGVNNPFGYTSTRSIQTPWAELWGRCEAAYQKDKPCNRDSASSHFD